MNLAIGIIIILIILISWYYNKPILLTLLLIIPCIAIYNTINGGLDVYRYEPPELNQINMNNINKITGPVSMHVLYNNKTNKQFILFGDYHTHKQINCHDDQSIYFPEYLSWLLKTNNKNNFDLFLEIGYTYSKKPGSILYHSISGLFNNYNKIFLDCHTNLLDKTKCQLLFPNAHFHNADYRKYINPDKSNHTFSEKLGFLTDGLGKYIDNDWDEQKLVELMVKYKDINNEILKLINNKSYAIEFLIKIIEGTKIKKNYTEADPMIHKHMVLYLEELVSKDNHIDIIRLIEKFSLVSKRYILTFLFGEYNYPDDPYYKDYTVIRADIIKYFNLIIFIESIVMDYYLIGRMFRSFISDNVIIIAGNAHIDNYVNLLKKLNYTSIFEYHNNNKCIDIQKLPSTNKILLK
jgi:hypothetical protein